MKEERRNRISVNWDKSGLQTEIISPASEFARNVTTNIQHGETFLFLHPYVKVVLPGPEANQKVMEGESYT